MRSMSRNKSFVSSGHNTFIYSVEPSSLFASSSSSSFVVIAVVFVVDNDNEWCCLFFFILIPMSLWSSETDDAGKSNKNTHKHNNSTTKNHNHLLLAFKFSKWIISFEAHVAWAILKMDVCVCVLLQHFKVTEFWMSLNDLRVMSCLQKDICSFFRLMLTKFFSSLLIDVTFCVFSHCFDCFRWIFPVEQTVRNGYKTTKLQLNASLNEITNRIKALIEPLSTWLALDMLPQLLEHNNAIESIILNRQCERFLHDLLNTLSDHQMHIDRCLKSFRCQLNKIHEIVKFRTAIPITSIFVSKIIELMITNGLLTFLTRYFQSNSHSCRFLSFFFCVRQKYEIDINLFIYCHFFRLFSRWNENLLMVFSCTIINQSISPMYLIYEYVTFFFACILFSLFVCVCGALFFAAL